jgi:hypothetical protein
MSWKPRTFLVLVASMGCWLERQAVEQIEYLKAENRLLRSRLGRRRLLFSDAERRTLATLARDVAAKALRDLDTLVSPLTPYPDDLMVAWPVSTRVNTPRNNDAKLIEPA